jgi:uncharacterized protein (TIGR00251 family)
MPHDPSQLEIMAVPGGVELSIKTVPNASRTRVVAVLGDALKVSVAAPPEGGKANAQVIELLAGVLGRRRAEVEIRSGETRPLKRVFVAGATPVEIRQRLASAIEPSERR